MNQALEMHPAQVELAKVFSSISLLGPPMSDKLVRLTAHLFGPEEAAVAKHLPFYYPKPLEKIARKAKRDPEEIRPLLETMAKRRVIYGGAKGYSLLPLIPGMFEYLLLDGRDSEWHREYARLLNELFASGYTKKYNHGATPAVRNLPVQQAVAAQSRVADSDLISELIDRHATLAVLNVCQCRQSLHFIGKECRRAAPPDGCLVFGSFAESAASGGDGRFVSKEEMREVVAGRVEKKLVFFTGNVSPESRNVVCTCCDCCCHFLETVNHYGGQSLLAAPHYLARVDEALCKHCGKCSRACNTYAHTWVNKKHRYDVQKCLGCGLCLSGCKEKAIALVANPAYRPPAKSFATLGFKLFPAVLWGGLRTRLTR